MRGQLTQIFLLFVFTTQSNALLAVHKPQCLTFTGSRQPVGVLKQTNKECATGKRRHLLSVRRANQQSWNYDRQGEDWIQHYPLCAANKRQSPIHIRDENVDKGLCEEKNLILHHTHSLTEYNLCRTPTSFKIEPRRKGDFGYATLADDSRFTVIEGHFHAPAEHTFGQNPDWRRSLEYHLVHKEDEGDRLLVVGITFVARPEASNPFINTLMNFDALSEGGRKTRYVPLEHSSIFPPREKKPGCEAYYYPGSLTTPPCTENVEWYVIREPMPASQEQVDSFDSYLRADNSLGNYRSQQNVGKQQNNFQKVLRTSVIKK